MLFGAWGVGKFISVEVIFFVVKNKLSWILIEHIAHHPNDIPHRG